MSSSSKYRATGAAILVGCLLFAISSAFHPPAANPWTGREVIRMIAQSPAHWQWDHIGMLAAVVLLFTGLSCVESFAKERASARLAARFFTAGLSIWLVILSMELTVMPVVSTYWGGEPEAGAAVISEGLFALGIVAGDFAMGLAWSGIALLGVAMPGRAGVTRRFARLGVITGIWGTAGIAASLLLPDYSLPILLATSGPAFVWTVLLGWRLYKHTPLHAD